MELTNEQWNRIEPIITAAAPIKDPRGRKGRDPRKVLDGNYGYYEQAHLGRIFLQGIRHTRLAIGGSSNGFDKGYFA